MSYDEWEFCQILEGHSMLIEEGGNVRDLRPGDAVVIRPGFPWNWRVLETTRKTYVIPSLIRPDEKGARRSGRPIPRQR